MKKKKEFVYYSPILNELRIFKLKQAYPKWLTWAYSGMAAPYVMFYYVGDLY